MLDPRVDDPAVAAPPERDGADSGELDEAALVESDLLVEDVSIDGMCGVY
jgi:mycofactocin precursor